MPTPPVVVKAWQQKRAEPFKSRHQSVAISAFPIINLCQLCLAECVGFSRGDDKKDLGQYYALSLFMSAAQTEYFRISLRMRAMMRFSSRDM